MDRRPPLKAAQRILVEALEREGEAQRLLLAGDESAAAPLLREVAELYRRSWEDAHETAYGRLVGMLKAAILAGGGEEEAAYARAQVGAAESPAAAYATALAALAGGDDAAARRAAQAMRAGDEAFARTAAAIDALAAGDADRYADAVGAVVGDFEGREEHLTGVPLADTALVLERLAERRGIAARPSSPVLP